MTQPTVTPPQTSIAEIMWQASNVALRTPYGNDRSQVFDGVRATRDGRYPEFLNQSFKRLQEMQDEHSRRLKKLDLDPSKNPNPVNQRFEKSLNRLAQQTGYQAPATSQSSSTVTNQAWTQTSQVVNSVRFQTDKCLDNFYAVKNAILAKLPAKDSAVSVDPFSVESALDEVTLQDSNVPGYKQHNLNQINRAIERIRTDKPGINSYDFYEPLLDLIAHDYDSPIKLSYEENKTLRDFRDNNLYKDGVEIALVTEKDDATVHALTANALIERARKNKAYNLTEKTLLLKTLKELNSAKPELDINMLEQQLSRPTTPPVAPTTSPAATAPLIITIQ